MRPMVSALQTVLRQTPVGEVFFKQVPGGGRRWEVGYRHSRVVVGGIGRREVSDVDVAVHLSVNISYAHLSSYHGVHRSSRH